LGAEERAYEVVEQRRYLAPAMERLDDRERLILHLRFFEGMTQTQIATRVGISQMHVSRLIRKSIEVLRLHMVEQDQLFGQSTED
jgi:RNA polymerase sigma-B factor